MQLYTQGLCASDAPMYVCMGVCMHGYMHVLKLVCLVALTMQLYTQALCASDAPAHVCMYE